MLSDDAVSEARDSRSASSGATYQVTKKLRYGFIGAGGIAGAHLRELARRDDVELVAMADISEAAMRRHGENFGIKGRYESWQEMLAREDLHAVSVCTPNKLHEQPVIDALAAGCHVLCEKPLAHSADAGARMAAAAKAHERKLVIGFQYRYHPRTQFLRRAFDDGAFGNILFARVRAMRRRGIPNWGVFGRKELQGGGPLIDIGVHVLEMAHYAMGSPQPVSATADMFTYIGDKPSDRVESMWKGWDHTTYTVEDLAVGRIRFANGAVAHVEAAFAFHGEDTWNFELMGDQGGARWDPPQIYRDEQGHMVNKTPAWLPKDSIFTRKMDNFVEHCLYDKPTLAPAEDGLAVQRMLDGLYRAAESGGEVEI